MVRKGLTSKQIARELGISHRTVEAHVAAVIDALQVNNRVAALERLHELGEFDNAGQVPVSSARPFLLTPHLGATTDYHANRDEARSHQVLSSARGGRFFPPLGGRLNLASATLRRLWMFRIAASAVMASCLVILFISGAIQLVDALR